MQKATKEDTQQKETEYKTIVSEYFKFVAAGKFEESLRFFALNCKTHNPFTKGNMKAIADAQIAASKGMPTQNIEFSVKHLLSGGDTVAAHTELLFNKSNPSEGGLRQVHLFRFKGDKIVEYWDITQMITKDMPNAAGAFSPSSS
jgi:predicted SnoaL-like aldol condensation-catalyzing enzyme